MRVVSAATARRLVDEAAARTAAARAQVQAAQAQKAQRLDPVHARVRAIQDRQEALRANGLIDDAMSAYAVMASGDTQDHLDGVPSYRTDKLLRGESYGARFLAPATKE